MKQLMMWLKLVTLQTFEIAMWQQRNYNIIISIYDINEILPLDSNYFDAMSIEAKNTFLEEFFEKISLGFCDGERQRHQ